MITIDNLLFPVDLSETSGKIAGYVRALAEKLEARVHLLTVVRDFGYFASLSAPDNMVSITTQDIVDAALERLNEFNVDHFSGLDNVEFFVVHGDIAERILEYASLNKIDLIIMGTHGRKGIEKIVFGSVTERVVKMSPTPVLTINPFKVPNLAGNPSKVSNM